MTTQSENVRVLVALTNLLLSQLAELRRLQADSQAAASQVTKLFDGITGRAEQTANEVKGHLSRALTAAGHPPAAATVGHAARPRRGVDHGPPIRGFS
jgi:hypothetical protein